MMPSTARLAAVALFALGAVACDADCDSPERLDGNWIVWSNVTATADQMSGTNVEDYPLTDVFFNGWSEWNLKYLPSKSAFQLSVDGQPYEASYTEAAESCNSFAMGFGGTYTTDTTDHVFEWTGDLSYQGSHIGGTWSYSDEWTGSDSDGGTIEGSITVPSGDLNANVPGSATDFSDTGS